MLRIALLAAIAALPIAADAQSYRCTGTDGKKYYGQSVPPQCLGMPVEQLNAQGMVTRRFDAAASAAEREKKVADEEERKKREAITALEVSMLRIVLLVAIAALPLAAEAQSYRCVGKDGKKYYGQSVPPQCLGMPIEQLNSQGTVTKRFDAAASAAEREKKAAEEEERKKREAVTKEEGRRSRALRATYTSEKESENARARALQENEAAVKDIEGKIVVIKKRQEALTKELDFYQGKNKPPAKLATDIKNAQFDLTTQEGLLATKKKEVETINAKYDDDKKRYSALTKGSAK